MMKLRFGHANTKMIEKYNGRGDLHNHLEKWTKAWRIEPRPEWVHIFCHTLDTIPMNWYLKVELRHDTAEWDVLKEGFILTFSFEDGFASIDEALQEIKAVNLRTPKEPMEGT